MKYFYSPFLLLTLLLGACSSNISNAESTGTENPASTNAPAAAQDSSAEPSVSSREAILSEVENKVEAKTLATDTSKQASNGTYILETGIVETQDNSRVRLDLNPDGTIIRVGPNSSFELTSLTKENGEPKTKLKLLFGQIFIILNGGSLDVQTPSGVASVRGSLMSITYSSSQNRTTATCLEGHCIVNDPDEEIELTGGQAADFIDGELNNAYREMTFEELGLWMLDNPDLQEYINEYPDLPDLPEDFNWDYDFNNDPEFQFFFDPEYDPGQQNFDPGSDTQNNNDEIPPEATLDPGFDEPPTPEY